MTARPRTATRKHASRTGIALISVDQATTIRTFPIDVSKPGVQKLLRAVAYVQRELDKQHAAALNEKVS